MQLSHLCAVVAAVLFQSALGHQEHAERLAQAGEAPVTLDLVVGMLDELFSKATDEASLMEKSAEEYKQNCDGAIQQGEQAVTKANDDILALDKKFEEDTNKLNGFSGALKQHTATIPSINEDIKLAKDEVLRVEQCEAASATYVEAIDALKNAIDAINADGGEGLLQSNATQPDPTALRAQLAATVGKYSSLLGLEGLRVVQIPTETSELVSTMKEVKQLVEDEKDKHDRACAESRDGIYGRVTDLEDNLKTAEEGRDAASGDIATQQLLLKQYPTNVADRKEQLETAERALNALQATCDAESVRFAEQATTRADELSVLDKAVQILKTLRTKFEEHKFMTLMQYSGGPIKNGALASLRAFLSNDGGGVRQTNNFLLEQAHKLNSSVLMNLASSIRRSDPFGKVRAMMEDLLARLKKEAEEETTQNEYCEKQLPAAADALDKKKGQLVDLRTKKELLSAQVDQLASEATESDDLYQKLDTDMEQAKDTRTEEMENFRSTVQGSEDAKTMLKQALGTLRDLFERGESLLQHSRVVRVPSTAAFRVHAPQPSSDVSEYHGMEDTGVVALLEKVYHDFETLEKEARESEATLAKAYEEYVASTKAQMSGLKKEQHSKTMLMQETNQSFIVAGEEITLTETLVEGAEAEHTSVQETCADAGSTEEERKQRIENELKALEEALEILEGEEQVSR